MAVPKTQGAQRQLPEAEEDAAQEPALKQARTGGLVSKAIPKFAPPIQPGIAAGAGLTS